MKIRFIMFGILLLFSVQLKSQEKYFDISEDEKSVLSSDIQRYQKLMNPANLSSVASEWFDVTYYKLNLTVTTYPPHLIGEVGILGVCNDDTTSIIKFDLTNSLHVDSVKVNGTKRSFLQQTSSVEINLESIYEVGTGLLIEIFYQGIPAVSGFGSFIFDQHSGVPWVWSLSEPYGARDWWPCKDHPSDKADSADIIVTCDSSFKVGSNGKLISVNDNGDGTKTHHWQERYPIASYLISIAITNYMQFSNWYHYSSTDSMEVLNYVIPERFVNAQIALPITVDMLEIFSDLFGLYPFIKEKYGHADFGRGGAMEHQTMTSTTTYNENTIAHELAHQWFGDMITCRTWSDLWLNEGFAQYSTALYLEKKYGESSYWNYLQNQLSNARLAVGSLYVQDTTTVRNLFDGNRVYAKGATVLHMLRHTLGDSIFFRSLYSYANDPLLKYSTANTEDFKNICERISGKDLTYFFDEWIYGEGYPRYSINWSLKDSSNGYVVELLLKQIPQEVQPSIFTMPIDIKLTAPGWDTTVTVFNNASEQLFYFPVDRIIKNVQLDPGGWILKDVSEEFNHRFILYQNYPNPCRTYTQINYELPSKMHVNLTVYNILGQKIKTLVDEPNSIGAHEAKWENIADYPSGVYYYRLTGLNLVATKKLLIIH
ncbi:MAG: T9SS type A sorting domain-containing protein [Ignavibacteriales bacterium]|nr:T9SS type A sorting domain-containing protein [Ignavibacteriales bacterium]